MHDLLASASATAPVSGNAHGSYLTIRSKNGLIFGIINVIGNFATVFQDQAVRHNEYAPGSDTHGITSTGNVLLPAGPLPA